MNLAEARSLVPDGTMNPDVVARLLVAVSEYMGLPKAVFTREQRWRDHLETVGKLQRLSECCIRGTSVHSRVRRALYLAVKVASTWASRNGKPHGYAYIRATAAEIMSVQDGIVST